MDHELQAGKNFAWSTLSQIILRIFGLAFFVLMSHLLGDVGMGQYNFIASFVVMWFIFIDFGAGGHLYREWSKAPKIFSEIENDFFVIFTLRLITVAIIFLPFLIVNYFTNFNILLALIIAFVSTFLSTYINLADSFFQSANLFRYPSIRQLIEKLIVVVVGSIGLFFYPRIEMVFLAILFSQFASLTYYFFNVLPFKFKLVFDFEKVWLMIKKGLPFLFIALFVSLYNRVDIIMLRYMDSFQSVGWYGTAYKFLEIASIFPAILFMPAIFPTLSYLWNDPAMRDKFIAFYYKAMRILFSFSLLLTLFLIFFSPLFVSWFFPDSFSPSILALRILILAQIIGSISMLFNNLLVIQHREYYSLYIIIFGAVFNIILNLFLIPRFSLYGAAWATVIAEIANLFLLQYCAQWPKQWAVIGRMIFVGIFNAIILLILKFIGQTNNYFIGVMLLFLNLGALIWLDLIKKEDVKFFLTPFIKKFNNYFSPKEAI